jgi:hypothetical protein
MSCAFGSGGDAFAKHVKAAPDRARHAAIVGALRTSRRSTRIDEQLVVSSVKAAGIRMLRATATGNRDGHNRDGRLCKRHVTAARIDPFGSDGPCGPRYGGGLARGGEVRPEASCSGPDRAVMFVRGRP